MNDDIELRIAGQASAWATAAVERFLIVTATMDPDRLRQMLDLELQRAWMNGYSAAMDQAKKIFNDAGVK